MPSGAASTGPCLTKPRPSSLVARHCTSHLAVVAGLAQPHVAGVNQRQHAVVIHGAAGKATVFVIGRIGRQGDGLVLPADQIAAGRVPQCMGPQCSL